MPLHNLQIIENRPHTAEPESPYISSNVTVTVYICSCVPASTGTSLTALASIAIARAYGGGVGWCACIPSEMMKARPSVRPAACASDDAFARASSNARRIPSSRPVAGFETSKLIHDEVFTPAPIASPRRRPASAIFVLRTVMLFITW